MIEKYLIVANGNFLAKSILLEAITNSRYIVALDGAVANLAYLGIKPHIILGDFDSIDENVKNSQIWGIRKTKQENINAYFSMPYQGNFGVKIVHTKDEKYTDLQKAIKFIKYDGLNFGFPKAECIDIVCANGGGRIDHELANYNILRSEYSKSCPIFMHSDCQTATFNRDETVIIRGDIGDHCGLFGMPKATVRVLDGLEYGGSLPVELNINKYSSSNKMKLTQAIVMVEGEALIIHPPMLREQRLFSNLPKKQQLEILYNQQQSF